MLEGILWKIHLHIEGERGETEAGREQQEVAGTVPALWIQFPGTCVQLKCGTKLTILDTQFAGNTERGRKGKGRKLLHYKAYHDIATRYIYRIYKRI